MAGQLPPQFSGMTGGGISGILDINNGYQANPVGNGIWGQEAQLDNTSYQPTLAQALQQQQQGVQQQQALQQQQGALGQALSQQAQGIGPSMAQMQLQQATGQNINNAASTIASQKGINPGLAARLIAQNQAGIQQQAAGQSAMTALGQQQAAQGQLASLYGQQQQGALSQAGIGGQLFGAAGGLQNAQNQGRIQNTLGAQGITAQGRIADQQATMDAQHINAGVAQQNAGTNQAILGGIVGGVASAGAKGFASGGMVPGDSPRNDTVRALLSPGEIVLPRSITQDEDAEEKAAAFVAAIRAKKGAR